MNKQTILNAYVAASIRILDLQGDIDAGEWLKGENEKAGKDTQWADRNIAEKTECLNRVKRQLACFLSRLEVAPVGKLEARQWGCQSYSLDITRIMCEINKTDNRPYISIRISWADGEGTTNCHTPEQALEMANHLKVLAVKAIESQGKLEHATAT